MEKEKNLEENLETNTVETPETTDDSKTTKSVNDVDIEELEERQDIVKNKKIAKTDEIKKRVEETREKAKELYENYLTVEKEVEEKSKNLAEQENNILKTTVANSIELLKQIGVENLEDEKELINEIKLENKETLLEVKEPSKGILKGLIVGGVVSIASIISAFVAGAKLSNMPLTVNSILQKSSWDSVADYFGKLIAPSSANPTIGYSALIGGSVILGLIFYKITTAIQKNKNKRYVKKLEESLEEYSNKINQKIEKLKELSEHIDHIKLVMQKYDIILQEQNAKIRRILFIEQPQDFDSLQKNSKLEIEKTNLILDELLKLMNTDVNEDEHIKEESLEKLKSANSVINEVIRKLYI